MTTTPTQQSDALRLAAVLEKMPGYDWNRTYCEAAFQLRHIQRQNECLTAENEVLRAAVAEAVAAERERLCAAIKAADDKASDDDYMLDSDDCISVIRGTWNSV